MIVSLFGASSVCFIISVDVGSDEINRKLKTLIEERYSINAI